jgi:hypothetical protein
MRVKESHVRLSGILSECFVNKTYRFKMMYKYMAIDKTMKDKLTDSEKKKIKQDNKAKANPKKSEAKKEKNDACREKRKEEGTTKSFA